MNGMSWLLLLPVIVALALFVGYFAQKLATARKLGDAESRAQRILDDAKRLVDQASRESESKIREAEAKVRSGELEAKELVLKNFIGIPQDQLLERLLELTLYTEENLR